MPKTGTKALQLAVRKVLDVEASAGSHALYLQEKRFLMLPQLTLEMRLKLVN